jgi:ribosome-associated toxin RatA of RatAB toxin-antitoxin module
LSDYVLYLLGSALLAFALLPLALYGAGRRLPRAHVASRSVRVAASPDDTFALISDVAGYPRWRKHVARVQIVRRDPTVRFRERGRHGMLELEVEASRAPERFVLATVTGSRAIFTGTWTFELASDGDGTRVTLTERGDVSSPIARLFARYVLGHESNVARTLADLRRELG